MAILEFSARRLLIAGGFAVAMAAAPVVALVPTAFAEPAVQACTDGESQDLFTGTCTPDLVPNSSQLPVPAGVTQGVGSLNGVPTIDGVPCEGHDSGQCIGLADEAAAAGPAAVPRSAVDGAPLG